MLLGWDSHIGTYQHHCESCSREFYGRKNRLYCNLKCKAKHNNERAATRRHEEKDLTEVYVRNVKVLSRALGKLNDEVVSMEKLRAMGFEPESPNKRVGIDNEVWYQVGPFGFRPVEESNEVELLRLERDDTDTHS